MDNVSHKTGHNVSHMPSRNADGEQETFQRIEVITGIGRRRQWSSEEKARMVAESLAPEMSVLAVARRHGINPNQLYGWRRQLRADDAQPAEPQALGFAPMVVTDAPPPVARGGRIEVVVGRLVVRVEGLVDAAALHQVLDAVRRLA